MYPAEWHSHAPTARKKRRTEEPAAPTLEASVPPEEAPASPRVCPSLEVPKLILRNINTASRAPATPAELDLDVILSRVPYKEILANLFGRDTYSTVDVPVVARVYEEAYMREPMQGERPCVAGDM